MMKNVRGVALWFGLFVVFGALVLYFGNKHLQPVSIVSSSQAPVFVRQIADRLNRLPQMKGRSYKIYPAGFGKSAIVPHLLKKDEQAVLWLGGNLKVNLDGAQNFGVVLTSNPLLSERLYRYNKKTYYVPEGEGGDEDFTLSKGEEIVVVGKVPYIEDILKEKKVPFLKYALSDVLLNPDIIQKAKGIVIQDVLEEEPYFKVPEIVLRAGERGIPVLSFWKGDKTVSVLYQFNDFINFYMFATDARDMIEKIINDDAEVLRRAEKNKKFVRKYFRAEGVSQNIADILIDGREQKFNPSKKALTLSLPTMAGHYGAGDYWLAKDMSQELYKLGYDVDFSYGNSAFLLGAETYIRLRSWFLLSDRVKLGDINVLYQIYSHAHSGNEEMYIKAIKEAMRGNDIFVSVSQRLANKMATLGYESYYLPQFTDENKFYPDVVEELKSEVLFVGNYHFNRQGVVWALEQGLPMTIYGDQYPKGVAKAPYIDNRILRQYYSSAKIVLNDTMPTMRQYGFISNRIFDATATGALVVSDYMPEIAEIYGDSVPMYKSKEELLEIVRYYLAHDDERQRLAKKAQKITLENFTARKAMEKLYQIIQKHSREKRGS